MRKLLSRIVVDTRPLKIVAFRRLWISTAVTAVGSQLTAVAVPKQIFDLTGSSGYVGLSGAVALVPLLVFGLWGGAIADAVDRRKLLLVTNTGVTVTSALLWLQAFAGIHSVWLVLGLLAANQAFFAINMPTRGAVVARLVPPALLPSANALNTTMSTFGAVFGPLFGGALIPVIGLSTLYLVDVCALLITLIAVWRLPAIPPLGDTSRGAGLRSVLDGFRYLAAQKVLLASFVVDIIAMVAGMPRALIPEMAERTFGDPPGGGPALGLLYAALPAGAVLIGLFSGWLHRVYRHGAAVVLAICLWGAAIAAFGLAHSLWLAVVFMALAGAADMISAVYRQAILQTATTDEMRGRLQGVFTVVVAGGPRIADLTHGWAAAAWGTTATATGGGLLSIVLVVVAALVIPVFWRYRAPAGEKDATATV
ncbi:putative MFS family arabinose efflux permease [Amycolatopsis sulphurea]|uniref:Putative MFS family arabinose efflux permease n=1 Tax=Amycolatopsis sulphurea TaxID=76022 RepID=A0A2A9FC88_9PSEU|nr:MFS transporter [Amycolatopsis sulphurea]PFG49047.1 putative MFS family arabinose efflux permease [Amycolatopsis sulphurea]